MKALVVYNAQAGRGSGLARTLTEAACLLKEQGIESESIPAGSAFDLSGKDLVVVAGGDGTLHRLLPELVKAAVPVVLLPIGTANVLAKELSIPRGVRGALGLIRKGRLRKIRLGRSADHYFHLMAGVGPDGHVIAAVRPRAKRLIGIASFWMAGISRFWSYPLRPLLVRMEGQEYRATFVVVSRARLYGRHFHLAPDADLFDSRLDVCLFTATRHLRFFRYVTTGIRGRHVHLEDVIYRKTDRVEVRGDAGTPLQMDGELVDLRLPQEFSVADEAIHLFVPDRGGLRGAESSGPGPGRAETQ